MSSDHAVVVRDRVAWVAADIMEARVASHRYSLLRLEGKFEKVRGRGDVRQKHVVIPDAVDESGRREVIDLDVGEAQAAPFEVGDDRAGNRTEPGLGFGLADPSAGALTIGASRTLEPGEAGDPAVILSWTAATP